MKKNQVHITLIVLLLFIVAITTNVNASGSNPVNQPWKAQTIDNDEPGVRNLSTAFVGAYQKPMLSYSKLGEQKIFISFQATSVVSGNCGPGNSWVCRSIDQTGLLSETVSNISVFPVINTSIVKLAFGQNTFINGLTHEYKDDMSLIATSSDILIELGKFGGILVGAPSIEIIGGHYRLAATIRDNVDIKTYKLVYMYRTGSTNTSCLSGGSPYQCDVIETSTASPLGAPSLKIAGDGAVGIAYYKFGDGVKYAYPWDGTFSPGRPSNCGPGGNTWRCISIDNPTTGTIGADVKLAKGTTDQAKAIVYNFKPTTTDWVMRATFVGSGGNCGLDGTLPSPTYRWSCSDVDAFINDITKTTYSIAFDPWDYPVIAYNNQFTGDVAQKLYISYPDARFGSISPGWHRYVIDGNDWSYTGPQSAISFSNSGLGFIGYVQPKFSACSDCIIDNSQNLRVILQSFNIFLPNVMK